VRGSDATGVPLKCLAMGRQSMKQPTIFLILCELQPILLGLIRNHTNLTEGGAIPPSTRIQAPDA
jgi:hypothetical protein